MRPIFRTNPPCLTANPERYALLHVDVCGPAASRTTAIKDEGRYGLKLPLKEMVRFVPTTMVDRFPEKLNDTSYKVLLDLSEPSLSGTADPGQQALKDELEKPTIAVAEYAEVQRILDQEPDTSAGDDDFEYFRVESGMNINVPKGRIKEIRFFFSIFADGTHGTGDACAIDGFPNDKVKRVKIIKGKIQLSINKLLKIVPHPVGRIIADAVPLGIELDPWEIDWGYNKLEVGFSEALIDDLNWYLSADNVNQSFGCYFTLKKRKRVAKVTGIAKAIWEYEPASKIGREWLRRKLKRETAIVFDKNEKTIQIM